MTKRQIRVSTQGRPWARYLRLSKMEARDLAGKTKAERLALTNAKLDAHLTELTAWMDGQGIPYADDLVFRDAGLSAWKRGVVRPAWNAMMAIAESGGLAGIGIVAIDRFTRDVTTMEALIRLAETTDIKIGGPRAGNLDLTTYEGIQQARGMAQQAANESLGTSFRLKSTLAGKMKAGKPMGGGRSFGFEVVGDKHVIAVPKRPAEVAALRTAAAKLLAGVELQTLAKMWNADGWRTARGGEWTGANLGRMLAHHRYGGFVEHHGEIVGTMPGEPIFDRDTYDAVQALFASRRRGRRPTGRYVYTGLPICSDCVHTMNGGMSSRPRADGTKAREYRCPIQLGGCGRCILADGTEQVINEHMVMLLSHPDYMAAIVAESTYLNEARAAQLAKLQAVESRLTELEVKWASGELIQAAYDRSKPVLDGQLVKLLASLDGLSPAAAMQTYDAGQDWADATDEERRAIIQQYRVRIVVGPGRKGVQRFDRDRITFPDAPAAAQQAA